LIEAGCLGTAVEELQKSIQLNPWHFESRLHLAQVHILNCHDRRVAERIIKDILTNPTFTPEQKALAAKNLDDWRQKHGARNAMQPD
jgi:hypothetical protein